MQYTLQWYVRVSENIVLAHIESPRSLKTHEMRVSPRWRHVLYRRRMPQVLSAQRRCSTECPSSLAVSSKHAAASRGVCEVPAARLRNNAGSDLGETPIMNTSRLSIGQGGKDNTLSRRQQDIAPQVMLNRTGV